MTTLTKSPVERLLQIREVNTLHGFQTSVDSFNFIRLPEHLNTPSLEAYVHKETGVESFETDDFLGNPYARISLSDRDRIPAVINAILAAFVLHQKENPPTREGRVYIGTFTLVPDLLITQRRIEWEIENHDGDIFIPESTEKIEKRMRDHLPLWLSLTTKLRTVYEAGETFSVETSERKFAKEWFDPEDPIEEWFDKHRRSKSGTPWMCRREDRWKTEEGKKVARDLCDGDAEKDADDWVTEKCEFLAGGSAQKLVLECGLENAEIDFPLVERVGVKRERESDGEESGEEGGGDEKKPKVEGE